MTKHTGFNYDEDDLRRTITGNISTRVADENIVYNLRFRFKETIVETLNDRELLNEYDSFAVSDWFGNNDERFLEWIKLRETEA